MKNKLITFSQLIPVILSLLLLIAHFYRARNPILMVISLTFPFILFIRHPLAARAIQIILVLASIEWIRTTFHYISVRTDFNMPWVRLAMILGFVAIFTFSSSLVFFTSRQKERYKRRSK